MDSTHTTNKASPGDQFCRHSLAVLFDNAVESKEHDKTRLRKVLRQVSLDTLATEWLNCEPRTIENRAYLIGTVLPQVVFGLEHVLKEAVSRQLIGPDAKAEAIERESADPNFNPINRLAEFLMRNNHRYSNFTETSPYVRGIRNTVAKLQHEMFMRSDNQLARLKAAVLRTQEERVKREAAEKAEYERRNACLSELFDEFLTGGQVSVESVVIHNSVRTFLELATKMPDPLKQCLIPLYETQIVEEPPSAYQKSEFILYVMLYAKPMTSELFDQFVKHLKLCASEYRQATEREEKKHIFTKFFVTCNTDQLDILSREKVLNLCETYFESAPPDLRKLLRDPRDWPVREYHLRSVQNAQETSAEKSQDSYEQEPDENNDAFITDQNNSATFTPVIDMEQSSEEPAQTDVRSETLISDVGANTSLEEPADLEFEIVSKVELSGDFTSTLKEEESEGEEGMVVVEKEKEEEEEAPVGCENTSDEEQTDTDNEEAANCNRTPADKNLREKTLIDALSARSTLYSRSPSTQSIRQLSFGYQPDKLTLAQFLHMMDCFLRDCAPKTVIQKFVTFLERQYHEDRIWREKMLMQANFSSFMENVKNKLSKLFVAMDNDSVGFVNLQLIEEEISQYQKGYYLPALIKAKRKLIQHVEFTRQAIQVAAKTTEESEPKANVVKTSVNADSMSVKKPLTVSNSQTIPLNQHDFQFLMINTIWPKLHSSTKLDSSINMETLDNLTDFVAQRQQRDLEQQVMINDRQAWLQTIDNAAKESVTSFNQVYRAVFQALIKDAIKYGEGKRISANISILINPSTTERRWTTNPIPNGPSRLRCVAAVPEEEASWLVGMELVASEPNISFLALKTAAMIHVPRFLTATSYSIHYWRKHQTLSALSKQTVPYRAPVQSASGEIPNSIGEILDPTPNPKRLPVQNELASCVVIPVADPTHKLIGVVGVDTMWSTKNRSNFEETELNFYQASLRV
ncbi:hypothetical protein EG68_02708 [Paragonimus skrjabini miyazakii]|uniref:EF-hand domain-containing protein n=1 Tax=Paragonimus skrjabini miyazakii TaxID=59628 RepID=A0A8S9Z4L8_9TREM|nr:hypothetical protein EG68_02708 [Paragonimus skrjabini miyazakii]